MNEYRWFWKNNPIQWWTVMLCVAFIWAFLVISINTKSEVDIFDIDDSTTDLTYGQGDDARIVICPSNRWYFGYIKDDDLTVAWTDNNGTTWTNVTVQSDGWKGETHMDVVGLRTWVDNTTVMIVRTEGADNAYDTYLFYLWGVNDPSDPASWNFTTIDGGAFLSRFYSMIFNKNGMLYIVWYENNAIRTRLWDVTTGDFVGPDSIWYSATAYPMVQCDHNNVVWVAFDYNAYTWIKDYDKTVEMKVSNPGNSRLHGQFFITADNTKVLTGQLVAGANYGSHVVYETVTNTTLLANLFAYGADTWNTGYWTTGNCYGNYVSVINLRTETGFDEYVRYRALYDAVDATWEASETVLWTIPTDDDRNYHLASGPNSVWPKINGVSVSRFLSGDMCYWKFIDEQGASDDYYDMIYYDSPTFPYWTWSPPPTITTPSLPDGTVDVFYSYTLSATGGELPYSWSFVTAPFWLNIGASNGTIYGTPAATGDYTVTGRVRDDIFRTDDETWTLTIHVQEAPVEPPGPPGRKLDFPVTMDTLAAAMWWIFMVMAMMIAVLDVLMNVRKKVDRGGTV